MAALPNLLVIGAQKCATSALHYYLDLHPEIAMSHPASLNFFVDALEPRPYASTDAEVELLRPLLEPAWHRGLDWYASHFSGAAPVRGEVSPAYTAPWFPGVAERIAATLPEVKLIFTVRDPIERMVANYQHQRAARREWRPPAEALAAADNPYLARSRYHAVLEPFLVRFDRSQLLVVDQAGLRERRRQTLAGIYRFLGVDPTFWSQKLDRERHTSSGKGRRHALFTRLQRVRQLRFAYALPNEVKWVAERLVYAGRSEREAAPELDRATRELSIARLGDDARRFRRAAGMEFADWSV